MRFVSMVDDEYAQGLIALIKSMEDNAGLDFSFTVIKLSDLSAQTKGRLDGLDTDIEYFSKGELGNFEFDKSLLEHESKAINQNKFLIYKLPYNEKMCYIDSDMLCKSDISSITEFEPLTAGLNIGRLGPESVKDRPMFNTGLMVFKPDESKFEEIQDFACNYDKKMMYGDQRIFNEFYYDRYASSVNLMGLNWNVLISTKRHRQKLWKEVNGEGIKFLHFTRANPWEYRNSTLRPLRRRWRRYKPEIKEWLEYYNNALGN